jgi:hypothetical protein
MKHSTIKVKTLTSEHTSTDHTGQDLSGNGSRNGPLKLAGLIRTSEALPGQWIKTAYSEL